jgi:hypothetical protein
MPSGTHHLAMSLVSIQIIKRLNERQREQLIPDYLIWGYPEVRDNVLRILRGGDSLLNEVVSILPGAAYHVVSIVSAPPYGVSRVYARTAAPPQHDAIPQVQIFDAIHRRWMTRLDARMPVAFNPAPPAAIRADYSEDAPAARATSTVTATLPQGSYLLRVSMRPGAGESNRRLMAALPESSLDQTFGELGPRGDFAGYFSDQASVILLVEHTGEK